MLSPQCDNPHTSLPSFPLLSPLLLHSFIAMAAAAAAVLSDVPAGTIFQTTEKAKRRTILTAITETVTLLQTLEPVTIMETVTLLQTLEPVTITETVTFLQTLETVTITETVTLLETLEPATCSGSISIGAGLIEIHNIEYPYMLLGIILGTFLISVAAYTIIQIRAQRVTKIIETKQIDAAVKRKEMEVRAHVETTQIDAGMRGKEIASNISFSFIDKTQVGLMPH
ncbi:hypothetical protein DFH27DRAFT_564045 [Peziza echinospora]|nr:hypothetical protein DFH27DRAFT_564045 [Peziza echinospora]